MNYQSFNHSIDCLVKLFHAVSTFIVVSQETRV